jgi:hypothetical protein
MLHDLRRSITVQHFRVLHFMALVSHVTKSQDRHVYIGYDRETNGSLSHIMKISQLVQVTRDDKHTVEYINTCTGGHVVIVSRYMLMKYRN